MTQQDLRTAQEWCEVLGTRVVDPDGWRDGTRRWDDPIDRAEFDRRLLRSTVFSTPSGRSAADGSSLEDALAHRLALNHGWALDGLPAHWVDRYRAEAAQLAAEVRRWQGVST